MKRLRMSISFKKQYSHVYEYLQRQGNKSEYIAKLVERDMQNYRETGEQDIRKIVLEVLQNYVHMFPVSMSNATATQNNGGILKEDADLINQLF